MRVAYPRPTTLDAIPIPEVPLNVNCRDEIVPILASLQHLYADDAARDEILSFITPRTSMLPAAPFRGGPASVTGRSWCWRGACHAAIAITTNCKTLAEEQSQFATNHGDWNLG